MKITTEFRPANAIEAQALISYVFEEEPISGRIGEVDQATGGLLKRLAASGEMTGKMLEMTLIHSPAGLKAERLLVVGAGKKEKFNAGELRKLVGAALRYLKTRGVKRITFLVRESDGNGAAAESVTEGLLLADFEGDKYKTVKKKDEPLESVALAGWDAPS